MFSKFIAAVLLLLAFNLSAFADGDTRQSDACWRHIHLNGEAGVKVVVDFLPDSDTYPHHTITRDLWINIYVPQIPPNSIVDVSIRRSDGKSYFHEQVFEMLYNPRNGTFTRQQSGFIVIKSSGRTGVDTSHQYVMTVTVKKPDGETLSLFENEPLKFN